MQPTARNISAMAGYDESDLVYSALPFYHVGGSMCTGPIPVISGARVVISPRFSATGSVRTMIDRQCTATQGRAAMFTMQIEIVARDDLRDQLALRKGWTASSPAVIRKIHDVLGIESIIPAYGMSECGMTIGGRVDDPLEKRINTVGRPTPGALVRISDIGLDGVGELQLGGPPVMDKYLDDPDAPVDPNGIIDACRAGIASFKVPRWVELVVDLPVMASGKVNKPALRARARERSPAKERHV